MGRDKVQSFANPRPRIERICRARAMPSPEVQRRLTAILSADVAGYSRLMGDDEAATVETITAYRKIFSNYVEQYRGRVVNAPGDSILAEFPSVVDAVNSAVEIQRELAERNARLPNDRRMDFRIGINLGDVVVKDDVIYGDGVNIAARLEALAEPGGICISRPVYDQVESKLNLECEYLGEQQVKNIAKPVRAYKVNLQKVEAGTDTAEPYEKTSKIQITLDQRDKPSIAVLRFDNLSADSSQEFFADGLVEDIITSLSSISSMTVIARNSTFAYKGKAVDVRQVAQELGVRYILEGSVRQGGTRLRITAQLIDSTDGSHIWAERYDRVVEDIFDIQDEITKEIITALRLNLTTGEEALVWHRGTQNVEAWRYCVEANDLFLQFDPGSNSRAGVLATKAVEIDPEYAHAWAVVGISHWYAGRIGMGGTPEAEIAQAEKCAQKARELDDSISWGFGLSSFVEFSQGKFEDAITTMQRGVNLYPGNADLRAFLGFALAHGGRPQEGINAIEDAISLNPFYPTWYRSVLSRALDAAGRSAEALEQVDAVLRDQPAFGVALMLRVAVLVKIERFEEANAAAAEARKILPQFRIPHVPNFLSMRDQDYMDAFAEALRKAGLPD